MGKIRTTGNQQSASYNTLATKLITKGIMGDKLEETVDKIVAAIPEASDPATEDKYEAALSYVDTYLAAMGTGAPVGGGVPAGTQQQLPNQTVAKPLMSDTVKQQVLKQLSNEEASREAYTVNTSIKKLLIDKPEIDFSKLASEVVPFVSEAKLEEYEKNLVQTEENIAAFKKIKEAVLNKTALPVNDKSAAARVIGCVAACPKADKPEERVDTEFTNKELVGYLVSKTMGVIVTDSTSGLSARLRFPKPKSNQGNTLGAKQRQGAPSVSYPNKKDTVEQGIHIIQTSTIEMDKKGAYVTKPGKLRIKDTFVINSNRKDNDGNPIKRTIRLSGSAQVPNFIRLEKYLQKFGAASSSATEVTAPTENDREKLNETIAQSLAYINMYKSNFSRTATVDMAAFEGIFDAKSADADMHL